MNDFFEGMSEDEIEIRNGVRPEDVSEEDAPIIKYVHSVIKDALDRRAKTFTWSPWRKIPHPFQGGRQIAGTTRSPKTPPAFHYYFPYQAYGGSKFGRKGSSGRTDQRQGREGDRPAGVTLPTVHGESIVMRILDELELRFASSLVFFPTIKRSSESYRCQMAFLVTGPTGSGKSLPFIPALNAINKPDRKIITVEDRLSTR